MSDTAQAKQTLGRNECILIGMVCALVVLFTLFAVIFSSLSSSARQDELQRDTRIPTITAYSKEYDSNKGWYDLTCHYSPTNPYPSLSWMMDDHVMATSEIKEEDQNYVERYFTLKQIKSDENKRVNYTCVVQNEFGSDSQSFFIGKEASITGYVIVAGAIVLLPFLVLAYKLWKGYRLQAKTISRLREFDRESENLILNLREADENPINKGNNGELRKSTVTRPNGEKQNCVIKTYWWKLHFTKQQATKLFADFENEIRIMQKLHERRMEELNREPLQHIVGYIGFSAPFIRPFEVYLIMEYCEDGDLETLLQEHAKEQTAFNDLIDQQHSVDDVRRIYRENRARFAGRQLLKTSHLLKWAEDLASAMAYIANLKIVIRDIACRNVLIVHEGDSLDGMRTKICDFGMAKILETEAYVMEDESEMPESKRKPRTFPAWSYPPEALGRHFETKYTLKSDVFCFGVFLWEMFQLASTFPYEAEGLHPDKQEKSYQTDLKQFLENGRRLGLDNLYLPMPIPLQDLVRECWDNDQTRRPSFNEVHERLVQIRRDCEFFVDFDEQLEDTDNRVHVENEVRNPNYVTHLV